MRKHLILLASIFLLSNVGTISGQENADRIAEIESQITELEKELKILKDDSELIDPEELLKLFENNNLAVFEPKEMTHDDFGVGPIVEGGIVFGVEENPESSNGYNNGRLIITDDTEQLDKLEKYYVDLGKESAMFYSHVFRKENVLLQMSSNVSEEIFNQYVDLIK